jgi:hypothetical protein
LRVTTAAARNAVRAGYPAAKQRLEASEPAACVRAAEESSKFRAKPSGKRRRSAGGIRIFWGCGPTAVRPLTPDLG